MMENNVVSLGIDQGIANLGFCVMSINKDDMEHPVVIHSGVLETNNSVSMQYRIQYLFDQLYTIIEQYPTIRIIGTESLFVNNFKAGGRNKSAAIVPTNMMTGAIMLLGAKQHILVKQYTPGTVKKYIAGAGDASKDSVEKALRAVIEENHVSIQADHQSDAIAIAWTAAMDVMMNGIDALNSESTAPKTTKKKKPRIVQTKEFMFLANEIYSNTKSLPSSHFLQYINKDLLNRMNEQAITGRFNKGMLVINDQSDGAKFVKVGFEVGKKTKGESVSISDGTWFCVELKGHEEKNIERSRNLLVRRLLKNPEYQVKPNGRIIDVYTNWNNNTFDLQIFIEVQKIA